MGKVLALKGLSKRFGSVQANEAIDLDLNKGEAMAATSFFALAYTLTQGAHIRVSVLLNLNHHTKFWLDAAALARPH